MLSNNTAPNSGSRDVSRAAETQSPRSVGRRSTGEVDLLDASVPVQRQRAHPTTDMIGTARYGGTETSKLYRATKDEDDAEDSGDVVVPAAHTDNSGRVHPTIDGEGECIVADRDGTAADDTSTCMGTVRYFLLHNDPLLYASLKWGLAALLILFLAFVVFGMLYSGMSYGTTCTADSNASLTEEKPGFCHTRFGTILGVFENTYAYSNCNDDYVSIYDSYMNLSVPILSATAGGLTSESREFYTGLEWQCVEYARRYWMINGRPKPAYFGSVEWASDIWDLTEVHLLENTSQMLPLHRYKNGDRVVRDGLEPPQSGDILIYPVQPNGFPVGHVAVITKVDMGAEGCIYVAEQNWGSAKWPGPFHNYSRKIALHYDAATTAIMLHDPAGIIMGWMRYG